MRARLPSPNIVSHKEYVARSGRLVGILVSLIRLLGVCRFLNVPLSLEIRLTFYSGTATVAGRHKDDTVKYAVVDPKFKPNTTGAAFIMEANKKAGAAIQQAKDNYWKTYAPKW